MPQGWRFSMPLINVCMDGAILTVGAWSGFEIASASDDRWMSVLCVRRLPRCTAIRKAHPRSAWVAGFRLRKIPCLHSTKRHRIRARPAFVMRPRRCFSPELCSGVLRSRQLHSFAKETKRPLRRSERGMSEPWPGERDDTLRGDSSRGPSVHCVCRFRSYGSDCLSRLRARMHVR